jgi:uncharacterized protein Yka (UPF0111/DUF47 family)
MTQERPPLLTDEELDQLEALAHALRSIAGNNQPHLRDNFSNEIDRLRKLVANSGAREEIRELAEELNSDTVLLDWAKAIHEGERVLDKLVLKLADENAEVFVDDE